MGDPFIIELVNPSGQAAQIGGQHGGAAVIFLLSEVDDTKNTLELNLKNAFGQAVTFDPKNPITVYMNKILPADVIVAIKATCPGWQSQVKYDNKNIAEGLILSPSGTYAVAANDKLTFKLTNFFFSKSETDGYDSRMGDFTIEYTVPQKRHPSRKVFLTQWADQPQLLSQFNLEFVDVPASEKWNVKVDEAERWIDKDADLVYSNPPNGKLIRARLAFRLFNWDFENDLHLNTDSVFTVSFMYGDGYRELADSADLVDDKMIIAELSTNDWKFSQGTDDSPYWTLTPQGPLTLKANGGSYTFLIDAVLANTEPPDNQGPPTITEMYVSYTHVPRREGGGNYNDGYLAATIVKRAPEPPLI